jgi:hypothetical protein
MFFLTAIWCIIRMAFCLLESYILYLKMALVDCIVERQIFILYLALLDWTQIVIVNSSIFVAVVFRPF